MGAKVFTKFADALRTPDKVRRLHVIVASRRTALPDFRLFPVLEELTLHGSLEHVRRFPAVFECASLKELTITGTSVAAIPAGFAKLQRLELLVLVGHRRLTALPEDIVELPNLRHMRVDHNRLTKLPEHIAQLARLEELVAYNNRIRELPTGIYRMKRLRWLELQGNALETPPARLMKMKQLKHLLTDFEDIRRLRA